MTSITQEMNLPFDQFLAEETEWTAAWSELSDQEDGIPAPVPDPDDYGLWLEQQAEAALDDPFAETDQERFLREQEADWSALAARLAALPRDAAETAGRILTARERHTVWEFVRLAEVAATA